jgi:integrase
MPGQFIQRKENNPRRIITEGEFSRILECAESEFADVLMCGYESGMRSGEIASLTPAQVHLDELHISGRKLDYIYLGIFDTKTGAERIVPVSSALKEILKRRMQGLGAEDYIFSRDGIKYTDDSISLRMKYTCKRAKVPYGDKVFNKKGERAGVVFHCCRHTRISKWVEMGFSEEIIRRASGHKSLEAFRRYVKLDKNVVMGLVDQNQNSAKTRQNLSKAL